MHMFVLVNPTYYVLSLVVPMCTISEPESEPEAQPEGAREGGWVGG